MIHILKKSLFAYYICCPCFAHVINYTSHETVMSNDQLVKSINYEFNNAYSETTLQNLVSKFEDKDLFELKEYFNTTYGPANFAVRENDVEVQYTDGHVFYLLGSGIQKRHEEFQFPEVDLKTTSFQNLHFPPEHWPEKLLDMVTHNDEFGSGTEAAGACCSKTLGTYGGKNLQLHSLKVHGFQGRTDPFTNSRAFNFIADDVIDSGHKRTTILYAAPKRHVYYWFMPLWVNMVEKTIAKVKKSLPDHELMFIFPAGDWDWNIDQCYMKDSYARLASNDNVLVVAGRDRIYRDFQKEKMSNYGGEDTINIYPPSNMIPTWRNNPFTIPPRRHHSKPYYSTGTMVGASRIAGEVAKLFVEEKLSSVKVKERIIGTYSKKAYGSISSDI